MYYKIRLRRIELDLSEVQLADKLGVSRRTVMEIEEGNYNPSLELAISLCKALGVTLNDLFWEPDNNG